MSKFILIKGIGVVNANAVSGFTWGFPSPTHFLGFVNALRLKLNPSLISQNNIASDIYANIELKGCAIFSHKHKIHTYQPYTDEKQTYLDDIQFSQKRGTNYMLFQKNRADTPPVIEEAKMNMTVSLLIEYDGSIDNDIAFTDFLKKTCYKMRLAGGSIFNIDEVSLYNIENNNKKIIAQLKRQLLPSFVLLDRSQDVQTYFTELQKEDNSKQFYDAWLDCCTLKQKARPTSDLITKFIEQFSKKNDDNSLLESWENHLSKPYQQETIPIDIIDFFANETLDDNTQTQWQHYLNPTEDSDIDWEYQPKPLNGYIVPIMTGYRALSAVIDERTNDKPKISSARDNTTPICFVESVHGVAEWRSVHRFYQLSDILASLWHYSYDDGWYLCSNTIKDIQDTSSENEFSEEALED